MVSQYIVKNNMIWICTCIYILYITGSEQLLGTSLRVLDKKCVWINTYDLFVSKTIDGSSAVNQVKELRTTNIFEKSERPIYIYMKFCIDRVRSLFN